MLRGKVRGMKTISLDLRERILDSYDHQEGTRLQIARRYRVSEGMVKKLLQQRRKTGDRSWGDSEQYVGQRTSTRESAGNQSPSDQRGGQPGQLY